MTPLVLLIGGASGTGKSGVAEAVAARLEIAEVVSTDSIRQRLREHMPADLIPSIHRSSFEAGESIVEGFLEQARHVLVEVDAAIAAARAEGRSIVVEGVHLVPGLVPTGAEVVHTVLRIDSEGVHRARFRLRDRATRGTRAKERYLARLDEIRRLQDFIVAAAEEAGVPVIESTDPERATDEVLDAALSRLPSGHAHD